MLLVPVRHNDGRRVAEALWVTLEGRLIRFGGVTRSSGNVGVWQVEGRTYRDVCRQYVVSLTSWRQVPAWLEVVEWACVAFEQEALYVEVAGVSEVLLRTP